MLSYADRTLMSLLVEPIKADLQLSDVQISLLARALSICKCGVYVGSGGALLAGGAITAAALKAGPVDVPLLGTLQPWQVAFVVMGVVGVPFLLLIALIREPERRAAPSEQV